MVTQTLPETQVVEQLTTRGEEPTEHPYVVWVEDTFRKKLVTRESRVQIWILANMYREGSTAQDLMETYPHVKPAAIYDAISYYLDHTTEIDAEIERNQIENVLAKHNARIDDDGFIVYDDVKTNE